MTVVTSNDIGGPWKSGKEENNNNINIISFTTNIHCVEHFYVSLGSKSVINFRPIYSDFSNPAVIFEFNI